MVMWSVCCVLYKNYYHDSIILSWTPDKTVIHWWEGFWESAVKVCLPQMKAVYPCVKWSWTVCIWIANHRFIKWRFFLALVKNISGINFYLLSDQITLKARNLKLISLGRDVSIPTMSFTNIFMCRRVYDLTFIKNGNYLMYRNFFCTDGLF